MNPIEPNPSRHRSRYGILLLAGLLSMLLAPAVEAAPAYHFVNGRILTMLGDSADPSPPSQLLVVDDRITAVGEDLPFPPGSVQIDLAGGYLIPGLTEMHAHVPVPAQGAKYLDEVLFLYLANGVTTIRGMLGAPAHLELRQALLRHEVLGPRLITSGPSFNGNSVSSPAEARRMVAEQAAAGYDFLKIHPGLTLEEFDAVAQAARAHGMPFAGHVPAAVGLRHALISGQATIDHLDGYLQALVPGLQGDDSGLFASGLTGRADPELIDDIASLTLAAGAAVVPTETLLENFAAVDLEEISRRPQNVYLPRPLYDSYLKTLRGRSGFSSSEAEQFLALRKRIIRSLHDTGVLLLLGSDAPQIFNVPGFSLHRELAAMTAAGLTPHQALVLGTRNPASFFDLSDEFGTLKVGAAADLIWLAADPLADVANSRSIRGVMARGRWLDRATLDAGLAAIAARHQP